MLRRRLVTTVRIGLLAALLAALLSPAASAAAAVRAPTGLSPDGTSTSANPVLSWNPTPGATSYRVEVSQSASFDSLAWSTATVNRQATPTTRLPSGQLHWRVRAADATGALGPWATAAFRLNPQAAPAQVAPEEGADLPQPEEPPRLVWAAVNGATSYEISVGTDPNLTTATPYTTRTTSFAFTTPQPVGTWYWQVRAVLGSGQTTARSGIRSYDVQSLSQPVPLAPVNSPDTVVQDVVLQWRPVPGASRYEVRVGTDESFNTVVATASVVAERWSPPVTLDNDQYWWQVRAYDSQNQTAEWSDPSLQT